MKIPSIAWMNTLKFKTVKYLYMIQTDIRKFGTHVPFSFTKLYLIFICIYN